MSYENKSHPSVKRFWNTLPAEHPFTQHPTIVQHGKGLAAKNFQYIENRVGGEQYRHSTPAIYGKLMEILQIEAQHREELTQLAKNTVAEVFGVPVETFDAKLTDLGQTGEDKQEEQEEEQEFGQEQEEPVQEEVVQMTPQLRGDINKRITANALLHGSAIHAMLTIHHLVAPQLRTISPRLLQLYTEISNGTAIDSYFQDIQRLIAQTQGFKGPMAEQAKVGQEWIEYRKDEAADNQEGKSEPAEERPVAVARAIAFPFLCQELAKGLMEIWSTHGLQNMTSPYRKEVYKHADRLEDEPYLFHIGPELWRQFLAVLPKGFNMKYVMATLFSLPFERFNALIHAVVQNPQQAKPLIDSLIKDANDWENPPEEEKGWTPDVETPSTETPADESDPADLDF